MRILMDITIDWMGRLNPGYTASIVNVLKSMPERIKTGTKLVQNAKPEYTPGQPQISKPEEVPYSYAIIDGIGIDWKLFSIVKEEEEEGDLKEREV
jgi:hypothetical protein